MECAAVIFCETFTIYKDKVIEVEMLVVKHWNEHRLEPCSVSCMEPEEHWMVPQMEQRNVQCPTWNHETSDAIAKLPYMLHVFCHEFSLINMLHQKSSRANEKVVGYMCDL